LTKGGVTGMLASSKVSIAAIFNDASSAFHSIRSDGERS
jgi:hypothetical protein